MQRLGFKKFKRLRPENFLRITIVTVVSVAGIYLLANGHAQTQTASLETENGTTSGGSSVTSDASASNGGAVLFSSGGNALTVNAANTVSPFNNTMLGLAMANWTFVPNWGKPFIGNVQPLAQAVKALNPGLIRYAGGLWANWVGFDSSKTQMTPQTSWAYDGQTYYYNYGTDELASLNQFAQSVGANVMIQVNVSNNDPAMWANLVAYAKQHSLTSLKYYEFGNELDLETANGGSDAITPAQYSSRVAAYEKAMLAQDPSIKFVVGVASTASDIVRNSWGSGGNTVSQYITQGLSGSRSAGVTPDSVSYHWYQTSGSIGISNIAQWDWSPSIPSSSGDWWKNSYARIWSQEVGPWVQSNALSGYPGVKQGISELGINSDSPTYPADGNQIGALWYSDVLGRLAYNGVSWATEWDSYADIGEDYSLMYPDNDYTTTPNIELRPTYYAYLMYAKYFGNELVQSATYDPANISIWASKDTNNPNDLDLRITNFSANSITAPINISGFTGTSGQAYVLSSTNPTNMSSGSDYSSSPTTLNGVKLNGNDVAASLATVQPKTVNINGGSFSYTFPAYSSTAIVLTGSYH